jgi:hypothetical protein
MLRYSMWVLGLESRIKNVVFRVWGLGCEIKRLGCRVQGVGFRVYGSRCRVQGMRFAPPVSAPDSVRGCRI